MSAIPKNPAEVHALIGKHAECHDLRGSGFENSDLDAYTLTVKALLSVFNLLAQAQGQTTTTHPDACDTEVFERGASVCMLAIPKDVAEAAVRIASQLTGDRYDWHYIGGRVHVKRLSAPSPTATPTGFVLMPKRITAAMREALGDDDWQWADLLAAAEVITEEEHALLESCDTLAELPAQSRQPDMFWNDADGEQCADSIHELIENEWSNGSIEVGDTMTVQQAIRLPNIVVRVKADNDGGVDFDEVAPDVKPEGGAA